MAGLKPNNNEATHQKLKEFLDKWHREVSCFIVSATPDSEILTIVKRRGLENYFIEVLGLSHSKKENLEYLFDKYSFEPGSCLF